MTPLFKKLQFKEQEKIALIDAPDSFGAEISAMQQVCQVDTPWTEGEVYAFVMIFVLSQESLARHAKDISQRITEDGLLWFAYPKKSSKNYKTDISRDTGWQVLGDIGYEGVRMVAIDTDWSALRLRNARFIKQMKRSARWAMSKEGKERTQKPKD